ncbi:MAG: OsmC family protein [Alphaproteobacteria bacterium]|nr:OsmC family protein [Alphaproteobacteria bacterium]
MRAVVVSSDGVGKFTQVVTAGKHTFKTDEPVEVGGLDSAPNPYEELLAALGSCTAMKVRREANVKGYSLDDVSITLDHAKVDGGGGKKIDVIGRSIKLQGNLTEEQRLDLLAAANRCPLMQTLTKGPLVTTALVESFDPPKSDAAPAAPRP